MRSLFFFLFLCRSLRSALAREPPGRNDCSSNQIQPLLNQSGQLNQRSSRHGQHSNQDQCSPQQDQHSNQDQRSSLNDQHSDQDQRSSLNDQHTHQDQCSSLNDQHSMLAAQELDSFGKASTCPLLDCLKFALHQSRYLHY